MCCHAMPCHALVCARTCSAGMGADRQHGNSHGTPRICTIPCWACAAQLSSAPSRSQPWLTRLTHPLEWQSFSLRDIYCSTRTDERVVIFEHGVVCSGPRTDVSLNVSLKQHDRLLYTYVCRLDEPYIEGVSLPATQTPAFWVEF